MHRAVFVGIATEFFSLVKFTQSVGYDVIIDVWVFFLHDTVESGEMTICDSVFRLETANFAISHAEGEVGVRVEISFRINLRNHLHLAFHIDAAHVVDAVVVFFRFWQNFLNIEVHHAVNSNNGWVFRKFLCL